MFLPLLKSSIGPSNPKVSTNKSENSPSKVQKTVFFWDNNYNNIISKKRIIMRKKNGKLPKFQTFLPFAKASIDVSNPKVSTNNSQNSPSKVNNNANGIWELFGLFSVVFFDRKNGK